MIKNASLSFFVGRRGSGKSTQLKLLIRKSKRIIVYDPMGEYARSYIYKKCTTIKEVKNALKSGWGKGFKIAYIPKAPYPKRLHELGILLLHLQEPYNAEKDKRELTFIIEEMNLGYPVTKLPDELNGMPSLTLQGRHYGINIIGVTQRPALVSKDYRANIENTYVFALEEPDDIEQVAKKFGRDRATRKMFENEIFNLKPHHFIKKSLGNVISRGKNPPIKK